MMIVIFSDCWENRARPATAAAHAIDDNVPVQRVDYPKLRVRLESGKQILRWRARPAVSDAKSAR